MWTCVADQDQKELDVKEVLCKILECKGSTLEQAQSQLREKLAGERYLLVLDDVWTEDRFQWRDLVKYLVGGLKGSWIMVTTRSHKTATIVDGEVYELQGLSKEYSWSLFEQSAFSSDELSNPPTS
uniref:NB-ARC domain-containing protein n=1 Tax=Chenopodium quinoa TaxID=63459 RepID=A0A803MTU6_CHEQI